MEKQMICFFLLIAIFQINWAVSIDEDPSLWPGHLKAFGTGQKFINVDTINQWPTPKEFFEEYVDKSRPVLFKGLAKKSPAFELWDDEYLKNHPGADTSLVFVEEQKKENRTKGGKNIDLKKFIETYQKDDIYMVNGCPKIIQKDVLIPPPLRCEETRRFLLDAVTWFSSGGTRSVIHHDDLDNINCLFRGSKKLIFVNYDKYGDFLPLDQGGFSSIDVDKVDYTVFPQLRHVGEYIRADMKAGDCLFIPYKWIHQVNSKANEKKQNVAVNIWFRHTKGHLPVTCTLSPDEATLDKYYFVELEKSQAHVEGKSPPEPNPSEKYVEYLEYTKKGRMNLKMFSKLYLRVSDLHKEDKAMAEDNPIQFNSLIKNLFEALDFTGNGWVDGDDYDEVFKQDKVKEYQEAIVVAEKKVDGFFEGDDEDGANKDADKQRKPSEEL